MTIDADMQSYGTRQSSHLQHGITRATKTRKCIIYLLLCYLIDNTFVTLVDNTSQAILDTVET